LLEVVAGEQHKYLQVVVAVAVLADTELHLAVYLQEQHTP
jgi:hypothetical protein